MKPLERWAWWPADLLIPEIHRNLLRRRRSEVLTFYWGIRSCIWDGVVWLMRYRQGPDQEPQLKKKSLLTANHPTPRNVLPSVRQTKYMLSTSDSYSSGIFRGICYIFLRRSSCRASGIYRFSDVGFSDSSPPLLSSHALPPCERSRIPCNT